MMIFVLVGRGLEEDEIGGGIGFGDGEVDFGLALAGDVEAELVDGPGEVGGCLFGDGVGEGVEAELAAEEGGEDIGGDVGDGLLEDGDGAVIGVDAGAGLEPAIGDEAGEELVAIGVGDEGDVVDGGGGGEGEGHLGAAGVIGLLAGLIEEVEGDGDSAGGGEAGAVALAGEFVEKGVGEVGGDLLAPMGGGDGVVLAVDDEGGDVGGDGFVFDGWWGGGGPFLAEVEAELAGDGGVFENGLEVGVWFEGGGQFSGGGEKIFFVALNGELHAEGE